MRVEELPQNLAHGLLSDHSPSRGQFWWLTSGQDIARMLQQANYSKPAREAFLSFYRHVVCPQLGPGPDASSAKSSISWDGNPFEYSFDLKGSSANPNVRIAMDVTQLRPVDEANPLCTATTQRVIDWMGQHLPGFDDAWYRSLAEYYVLDHLPASQQKTLIAKAGHRTSLILGFDIHNRLSPRGGLSGLAKIYFTPCLAAAAYNISRWEVVRRSILRIPGIEALPNITASLGLMEDFLAERPAEWKDGARFLATDFAAPEKARFKIYMRCLAQDFESLWDCYTLGGRITGMDEDKPKIRDFVDFVSACEERNTEEEEEEEEEKKEKKEKPADSGRRLDYTTIRKKATYIYYSLSANNPIPAPKLGIYPSNTAANDRAIARGIDRWLEKYGWRDDKDDNKSIEEKISNSLTHRRLEERTGIFTFVGIGRKEDPVKKGLSIQTYLTSELYDRPRICLVDGQPVAL